MYYLRDEACTPIDLTEEEYSWMVESQEDSRFEKVNGGIHGYFWGCGHLLKV